MIGRKHSRTRHLHDERLYECYVAEQTGDALDPPAADHLADCADCQARYAELASFVGAIRAEADSEIDALFPAEALQAQQSQIARRIEHLGHAARVISFPHHPASGSAPSHGWGVAPRWVAAAAAAGLFIGVGVDRVGMSRLVDGVGLSHMRAAFSSAPAVPGAPPKALAVSASGPIAEPTTPATDVKDADSSDEFLAELEFALERPRTRELRALDELTPHIREISLTSPTR